MAGTSGKAKQLVDVQDDWVIGVSYDLNLSRSLKI